MRLNQVELMEIISFYKLDFSLLELTQGALCLIQHIKVRYRQMVLCFFPFIEKKWFHYNQMLN